MNYEDEYYIVTEPDDDKYPDLEADIKTASRDYKFDLIPPFSDPVVFKNSEVFDDPDLKSKFITHPLLMTDTSFIAIDTIKDYLTDFATLKGMKFHPAIYIASADEVYKNYWFLNIYSELDCWDRQKSQFTKIFSSDDDLKLVEVEKYVFDQSILNSIDEEDRLIFRMGGTAALPLFVHQRIIDYFEEASVTGYRAFKVSEYEFGMEF